MVRLLGLSLGAQSPREVTGVPNEIGDSGWLIRFFDSAFFCEWIAVSYLYKHDHPGVRDYLCNRMYTLPPSGIESYLFQICYMLVHKPSPSLDKFVIDMCSKSLQIALKVHWFLLAELEDTDDTEGISRIQEKCQIAATLMGDWIPLGRPHAPQEIPGSNAKARVMDTLLSSKQRLLSFTSSPPPPTTQRSVSFPSHVSQSSPLQVDSKADQDELDSSLKALKKKLMPGPKLRETLFFRKSLENDHEQLNKSKDSTKDSEQEDGLLQRILKEFKEDEDKSVHNEELTPSSDGFFKRLFRERSDLDEKSISKSMEDAEKEGFFKRLLFKDKHEGQCEVKDANESVSKSMGEYDKDGFFTRLLSKDKHEDQREKKSGNESVGKPGNDDDKEGFFKRLLSKEKHEDQRETKGDNELVAKSLDDDEKEGFFKRLLFKDKHESQHDMKNSNESVAKSGEDDDREGFFKRFLFKDKQEDHPETKDAYERPGEEDKGDDRGEDGPLDLLSFGRLFRVHPGEEKSTPVAENGHSGSLGSSPGTEKFFRRLFRDRDKSVEDSELFGSKKHKEKRPGSPIQRNDKLPAKPPLPNNLTSQMRKGTYHSSLEFVQFLCDTSSGLVDIFPIEDRKTALRESLADVNGHIAAAQDSGGVCYPLGKDIYQVVNIPEDETVLLNSREKAPYLICVEVMKGEVPSHKGKSDAQKFSRGGIPLASGDVQLQKPPPWAYPLWNSKDFQHSTDQMLRKASLAIDQAMAHLWEAKVKFVHVGLSVEKHVATSGSVESSGSDTGCENDNSSPPSSKEAPGVCSNRSARLIEHNRGQEKAVKDTDAELDWVTVTLTAVPGVNMEDVVDEEPPRKKDHRRVPSTIAIEEVKMAAAKGEAPPGLPLKRPGQNSTDTQSRGSSVGSPKATDALSGELWEQKKERIRNSSEFGKLPGWDLRSVIVKSGDDCRQEHLAVQLLSQFYDIYQEAGLPLWLRPYEVLVTSSYTALIETIPDTASIHAIKSRFPNITSLRDFFSAKFEENSPGFKLAQTLVNIPILILCSMPLLMAHRNFVESMAGYSIFCYLLQVKDRHNGNLLLDEEGHIIHIDFGFMLSNSPGGVNFESAPFKLTRELLEVMDSDAEGTPSEFFDYFKVLCIQGFLTCRKHAERIILLVEMLQDSGFPCFKGGPRTIQNLRKRFHLSLTEEQCVSLVLSLISSSLDAWRTRQYDYYQRVLNGIL